MHKGYIINVLAEIELLLLGSPTFFFEKVLSIFLSSLIFLIYYAANFLIILCCKMSGSLSCNRIWEKLLIVVFNQSALFLLWIYSMKNQYEKIDITKSHDFFGK